MKILVVCQHYYPEPFRITDICEELVKRGNAVTVVTGTPNYPMGEIYPGYEGKEKTDEIINGVTVHRCRIHPRKTGVLHRLWNYYSYSHQSKKYIDTLDDSFDVVFINQLSPVMMANAGIRYAKKHNKKSVLYCLDLWPASLNAGGITGGVIYRWFHREAGKVYRHVHKILISSKSFAQYLQKQFGVTNTAYLPQYAEDAFSPDECRKTPDEYIDLMFAGNIGTAQSVDTIIRAAARCKDIENLRWHIVGDGIELDRCKALAEELDVAVTFYGRRPIEQMPQYYAMADAMLVTMQKDSVIGLTLPGKIQSYLAAGKFIIGVDHGETAEVIRSNQCGLCCDIDDPDAFAGCIRSFAQMHADAKQTVENNSYITYTTSFSKTAFFEKLITELSCQYVAQSV